MGWDGGGGDTEFKLSSHQFCVVSFCRHLNTLCCNYQMNFGGNNYSETKLAFAILIALNAHIAISSTDPLPENLPLSLALSVSPSPGKLWGEGAGELYGNCDHILFMLLSRPYLNLNLLRNAKLTC